MPLNQGQIYENNVNQILINKGVHSAVALNGNDSAFVHNGISYYVEIKNKKAPDYGQKRMIWDANGGWQWSKTDVISQTFDVFGVMDNHIDLNFIPKRYSVIPKENITVPDKRFDQRNFKRNRIYIPTICLHDFYARRNCFYIQIEGKGFYYLQRDAANLGVPQYNPDVYLRLRAKTHSSKPTYNYSFFAVINANKNSVQNSDYDLEELDGRSFPPI